MKSEDKTVLEELGVAFCASLSDDIRHKRADAGLVKTAHHLVEQGEESVPKTLRRELCMPFSPHLCDERRVSWSWVEVDHCVLLLSHSLSLSLPLLLTSLRS